jgi:hypothetical protein
MKYTVFENEVRMRIFGLIEWVAGEKHALRSIVNCAPHVNRPTRWLEETKKG